jgi:signal transduction histidine kinase
MRRLVTPVRPNCSMWPRCAARKRAGISRSSGDEKAHIARELHDELGQLLTALKMDLSWLRERLPGEGETGAKMDEMGRLLDQTVSSTRRISADLRPLMLDDLGLADAASWLVGDFGKL